MAGKSTKQKNNISNNKSTKQIDNIGEKKNTKQGINPDSYYKMKAGWRFHSCYSEIKWSISKDNWAVWEKEILPKLIAMQGRTWADITSASKSHGSGSLSHSVNITGWTKEAQEEMERLGIHRDVVFSLRLSAKERIIGFLEMGVLEILCYTPEHEFVATRKR